MSVYTYRVRSQPEYSGLRWDHSGVRHLLIVLDKEAVSIAASLCSTPCPGQIDVFVRGDAKDPELTQFMSPNMSLHSFAHMNDLMQAVEHYLDKANMGLRLYALGHEDGLWKCNKAGQKVGMSRDEIQLFQACTKGRPVYCVHCGYHMSVVHTNITACEGCGRHLFVRDHFSRLKGAYMGFQIDAETPGVIPPIEQVYP